MATHKPMFGQPLNRMKVQNTVSGRMPITAHVFDGGGGYYETTTDKLMLAEGAVYKTKHGWYKKHRGVIYAINYCDIPADAKATILLLQLDI